MVRFLFVCCSLFSKRTFCFFPNSIQSINSMINICLSKLFLIIVLQINSISSLDIMANQTFTSPSSLYFENSTKFEIVSSSKSHESNYYLLHSMEKNSLPIFISILGIIFFSLAIMFYIYYYRKYNRKSSNVNQQRDEMFVSIIDYIEKNPTGKRGQTLYSNSYIVLKYWYKKGVAYIDFFPIFFNV